MVPQCQSRFSVALQCLRRTFQTNVLALILPAYCDDSFRSGRYRRSSGPLSMTGHIPAGGFKRNHFLTLSPPLTCNPPRRQTSSTCVFVCVLRVPAQSTLKPLLRALFLEKIWLLIKNKPSRLSTARISSSVTQTADYASLLLCNEFHYLKSNDTGPVPNSF
ncbi:hypothetical protein DENSPDRAFT_194004 [Dentipellis sp. KUC8613]|nr:hypothetical protein DENSPDRAFT_194004 [Dentipellis sp. KUC8613]